MGGGHDLEALEGEFLNGNHRYDGGIFDGVDELVGERRDDDPDRLRQDDDIIFSKSINFINSFFIYF